MADWAVVRQRTEDDCGVCCLAMMLDWSYEQASNWVSYNRYGPPHMCELQAAALRAGVLASLVHLQSAWNWDERELVSIDGRGLLYKSSEDLWSVVHSYRAIVTIPNTEEYCHALYWNGTRVWNPSDGTSIPRSDLKDITDALVRAP